MNSLFDRGGSGICCFIHKPANLIPDSRSEPARGTGWELGSCFGEPPWS